MYIDQLREAAQIEHAAQEIDAGQTTSAAFVTNDTLDSSQITKMPMLQINLHIDRLFTYSIFVEMTTGILIDRAQHCRDIEGRFTD
jgi:hypothetical protein